MRSSFWISFLVGLRLDERLPSTVCVFRIQDGGKSRVCPVSLLPCSCIQDGGKNRVCPVSLLPSSGFQDGGKNRVCLVSLLPISGFQVGCKNMVCPVNLLPCSECPRLDERLPMHPPP